MRGERFAAVVRAVTRRPLVPLVVVAVLALAGAVLALAAASPAPAPTRWCRPPRRSSKATERFKRDFGDEAVVVLVKGDLQRTVLTPDLGRLIKLEGCLSGNVPARGAARAAEGLCASSRSSSPRRWCSAPARSSTPPSGQITDEFTRRRSASEQQADQAASRRQEALGRAGRPAERASRSGWPPARAGWSQGRFTQEVAPDRPALRHHRPARRSTAPTSSPRWCSTPARARSRAGPECRSRASPTCSRARTRP